MVFVDLDEPDEEPLVAFLLALTDERVPFKKAPFDHPQLVVANGGTSANPRSITINAVGASGSSSPLPTFLALQQEEVARRVALTSGVASAKRGDPTGGSTCNSSDRHARCPPPRQLIVGRARS